MPLKSDSTARREPIMVAMVKAARAAAAMSRRFAKERRVEKFPTMFHAMALPHLSARAGAEGRARGEGAGAHAEARGERRGNVAEEVAAAGTMTVAAEGSGEIGAEPVTAGFAKRIDALHGEAGQVLHLFSLSSRKAQIDSVATVCR